MRSLRNALAAALLITAGLPPAPAQSCPGSTVDDNNAQMAVPARAFVQHLQTLVASDDRQQIATLIAYPLRINRGPKNRTLIRSRADFLAHYDSIITPKVRSALANKNAARCLFYNSNGFMIGNGEIWFDGDSASSLKIISMNL